MYLLRLDDASDFCDLEKWLRMEKLLLKYSIKPLFGVIPENLDPDFLGKYRRYSDFWTMVHRWIDNGWIPALHGYNHISLTSDGGLNPINHKSEFAGVSLSDQEAKISRGLSVLENHGVRPNYFFAPFHTFDINTIIALKNVSNIRFISDTIAFSSYSRDGLTFVPQQSGSVRKLPFKIVTFCYHPNAMTDSDFKCLERFLRAHSNEFSTFSNVMPSKRKYSFFDLCLSKLYFSRHH
jgi:hypothetical protein